MLEEIVQKQNDMSRNIDITDERVKTHITLITTAN